MKQLLCFLLLLVSSLFAQAQNEPAPLIMLWDTIPFPKVCGEPIVVEARPLTPPNTPGNRIKSHSWVYLDYSKPNKIFTMTANLFLYVIKADPRIEYHFYCSQSGEALSLEEYQKIKFTNMPEALRKIKLPQNQSSRSHPKGYRRELWEVARWQHPNLYVVLYDKKRKSYYRYRVGLVIYCDETHPNATPPKEE